MLPYSRWKDCDRSSVVDRMLHQYYETLLIHPLHTITNTVWIIPLDTYYWPSLRLRMDPATLRLQMEFRKQGVHSKLTCASTGLCSLNCQSLRITLNELMDEFELNLLFCMFLPFIYEMNLALNLLNLVKPLLNLVKFQWIVKSLFYLKIHCCLSFEWGTFHSCTTKAHSALGRNEQETRSQVGKQNEWNASD